MPSRIVVLPQFDAPMKKEEKSAQIPCYKEYDELAEVTCGFG
jgi:hypothetical protein